MAEERIYVAIIEHQTDIRGKDFTIFKNGTNREYTIQYAIERMAKSLFKVDNVLALDIKWSQLKKSKQLAYKVFAEAALNALLEADNGGH